VVMLVAIQMVGDTQGGSLPAGVIDLPQAEARVEESTEGVDY
jgi:hypothetical protein